MTARTHLARRLKLTYSDNVLPIPFSLIVHISIESADAYIGQCLRKVVILHHIACSQGFKANSAVVIYQILARFVKEILTLISNLLVLAGEQLNRFLAAIAALLFTRNTPLQAFQPF